MRRTFVLSGLMTLGLAFGVAVQPAAASGSDNLSSSMSATCVGMFGGCDVVDFVLDVEGQMYMEKVTLFANGPWAFGSIATPDGIWSQGSPVSWNSSVVPDKLIVSANLGSGTFDPEPIRIRVNMTSAGNASQLSQIRYNANGYANADGTEGFFSTQGNVVPEPITTVLLGTGLAGLAGVGARRKKERVEEGEDAA